VIFMNMKMLNKITAVSVSLAVLICLVLMMLPPGVIPSNASGLQYPQKLFGADIIEIDIRADENEWRTMLDNATAEEYISCDVLVNGTLIQYVGIRPKGNSSLSMVAGSDSDRYSFKFKFDEYIKGQSCFGLDKFVVNNIHADYTYMKEYLSYSLMEYMGVDSPLVNYAHITVNGQEWGLYLAVESYEDSFVQRVYQSSGGNLYSVKMAMGKGREETGVWQGIDEAGGGFEPGNNTENLPGQPFEGDNPEAVPGQEQPFGRNNPFSPEQQQPNERPQRNQIGEQPNTGTTIPESVPDQPLERNNPFSPEQQQSGERTDRSRTGFQPDAAGGFDMRAGKGGFTGRTGGGSLVYTDDSIDSYPSVFGNTVFKSSGDEEYERLIEAIKKLSIGEELEKYFDVDQILRYFAVHTTVVNLDSYISNMQQNYYLYEENGRVAILPWDYNHAFGGFQSGNAASAVNFPIDTPVSGVELSDRPLIGKLLEVPEYMERYHGYLQEIVDFFSSGRLEDQIRLTDSLISVFVEKDATAFCTPEQYIEAVKTLTNFCLLRAESIRGQLDGTIPSTTQGQADSDKLIDASNIILSTMGSQGFGRIEGGQDMNPGNFRNNPIQGDTPFNQFPVKPTDGGNRNPGSMSD